jgi:hypothetical protein
LLAVHVLVLRYCGLGEGGTWWLIFGWWRVKQWDRDAVTGDSEGGDGERLERLVLWRQFIGAEWELPAGDEVPGERLLVGWKMRSARVDAGPPPAITRILATVLCRHATLTFARALRPPMGAALLGRPWQLNRHFIWATTSTAEEAVQGIFHGDFFSWTERGQVVILSPPGAPVPLTENYLQVQSDAGLFGELAHSGSLGVLLPGVDGQVAGLYFFTAALARAVSEGLDDAARSAGAQCAFATADNIYSLLRE